MSRYLVAALLLAACPSAPCWAAPPTRPNGPPPELLTVRIGPDGNLVAQQTVVVYREEERARMVVVGGKEVFVREKVVVPTYVTRALQYPVRDLKAFDLDGLPIDAGKLPKLLDKDTSVIVSPDGEPPDAFYRQYFKEGTLLLVLPGLSVNSTAVDLPPPPMPGVAP